MGAHGLASLCLSVVFVSGGVAMNSTWQQYVRSPSSTTVLPTGIISGSVTGNVSNPAALLGPGHGQVTMLTRLTADAPVPCLGVDFGMVHAGLVNIHFASTTKGPPAPGHQSSDGPGYPSLRLVFSETLQFLGNTSDFTRSYSAPEKTVFDGADHIAVQLDPYTWTDQLGCGSGSANKVCSDGLHGFRYLNVCLQGEPTNDAHSSAPYTSPYGSVAIASVDLTYSGFLGTPDTFTGWFECSDANLTQWWFDGVYTTDLATDVFWANDTEPRGAASRSLIGKWVVHDGAKRDRDPYVGDLAVSSLTSFLAHDFHEATENVLADLVNHQGVAFGPGWVPPASINNYTLQLFDYPLWWVKCTHDLVYYTGNTAFLDKYFHALVLLLDSFYPNNTDASTGLLTRGEGWGDYAFTQRSGPVTYYNALYVLALNQAADLAEVKKESTHAATWRQRAANVSAALTTRNWDASVGAFFDGSPCGKANICATHAQDGNSLAVLAGVLPNNGTGPTAAAALAYLANATARPYGNAFFDNDALLGKVDSDGDRYSLRVYAFLSYFELAARFSTPSMAASGFEELRRLYGWMSKHDPGVTFWEGVGPGGAPYEGGFTSMAHGWSTGVTPLLTSFVLGVTPTAPGFATWQIRPVVDGSGLSWARGAVPTPNGNISVWWTLASGSNEPFSLRVQAPAGTSGLVALPVGSTVGSINNNNASVLLDGNVVFDLASGLAKGTAGATLQDGYVDVQVQGGTTHDLLVQLST